MTTAATSLLGLALPVTGELSGTWGDTVNNSITALLDSAVAGTTTLSADADVTLTTTTLAANQAREAIILWTAAGTVTRNITAPAQSKTYVVLNKSSTQSIVIRGAGPTTGVTVLAGKQAMVAWDGADFVEVSSGYVDGPASSTDNAVARFDGTDGKTIQNSVVIIADTTGNMSGVGTLGVGAITTSGALVGAVSQDAFNTVSTTLNLGGAATTVNIGAATGTLTVANTTLAAKAVTATSLTNSALTATRVLFAGTAGLIQDDADLTFNGTVLTSSFAGPVAATTLSASSTVSGTGFSTYLASPPAIGGTAAAAGTFTALTGTSITNSGLTATRVVYSGTAGLETDSANLTFNGTILTSTGFAGPLNGTVGATTANTGAFTTLTTTGTINLITVGRGAGAIATNTAVGTSALAANTTGANNTAVGNQALVVNTTGALNAAFGAGALQNATTADANTALGIGAQLFTTTGAGNTSVGRIALFYNTTGASNVAVGKEALLNNTTASNNTAVGYQAGYTGTTAEQNSALGYQALYNVTTGSYNTAVGYVAGKGITTGSLSTAIGRFSMATGVNTGTENVAVGNSTLLNNTSGSYNVALGNDSLKANTTASNNTAVGYQAGYSNTTADVSVYMGGLSGYSVTTGGGSAFLGYRSGYAVTTGTSNTLIGAYAGQLITTGSKNTIIGAYQGNSGGLDIRTASNYIVLSDGDGNPLVSTADNQTVALEGAVPNSGTGITFPATQVASSNANTLDDYEEGTWTAAFASTGGTITISTSNRTGKYVKIGSQVTVTGVFVVTSVSSPTGELTMSGIPFANGSADSNACASAIFAQDLAATAITAIQAKFNPSATSLVITRFSAGAQADLASSMQASTQIFISLTYFV